MSSECESCCENGECGQDRSTCGVETETLLKKRMGMIKKKYLVMSGKGGVGKSTISVNLATGLALEGLKVGLLDTDIHGPSIPTMLNLHDVTIEHTSRGIKPVETLGGNLKVISVAFFLENSEDAVIWRGPAKMGAIKQFLEDVDWGELDCLIIDSPPGTGDEPLSVVQLIEDVDGAIVITTPQQVATADVKRSITFCNQMKLPVFGVIENMSGFKCPNCDEVVHIFDQGGGKALCDEMKLPFLGKIPIDPDVVRASDKGKPYIYHHNNNAGAKVIESVVAKIVAR